MGKWWIAVIVAGVAMVGYWFLMGMLYRTQVGAVNLLYFVPHVVIAVIVICWIKRKVWR